MQGFAVLDLETTGLSTANDRIIELCVVYYDQNGIEQHVYSTLVNPERSIPAQASSINGITDSMVAGAPTFRQIAGRLAVELEGRVLVGHNIASFDKPFLVNEFAAAGVVWRTGDVLDTLHLARKSYPSLKSHRLAELCKLTGIANTRAHRAESDARTTWQLLCTIAADDVDDLTDLDKYELPTFETAAPPQLVARRPVKPAPDPNLAQTCVGEVVTFTGGTPPGYGSRDDAKNEIVIRGGRATSGVTKATTIVFAGDNAGSKLDRARAMGVLVAPHSSFTAFLLHGRIALDTNAVTPIRRFDGTEDVVGQRTDVLGDASRDVGTAEPGGTAFPPARTSARSQVEKSGSWSGHDGSKLPVPPTTEQTSAVKRTEEPRAEQSSPRSEPTTPAPHVALPVVSPTAESSGPSGPLTREPARTEKPVTTVPAHSPTKRRRGRDKSRALAVVMAVLLGSFGVHCFYYGHRKRGAVMLAVSVASLGLLSPLVLLAAWVDAYRIATDRLLPC